MPPEDDSGPLYPELDAYLSGLARLGLPIILTSGERGPARPYAHVYAQRRVREARAAAKLGSHVTLDACRHGGMTELGDAELTVQGVMTLSGRKRPASTSSARSVSEQLRRGSGASGLMRTKPMRKSE